MDPEYIREELKKIEAIREDENIHYLPGQQPPPEDSSEPEGPWPRFKFILQHSDTEPVEVITGAVAFLWGTWLLNPFMATFTAAPEIFSAISAIAPEWAWGLIAFLLGVCQLGGVLWGASELRKNGAFMGFFFWAFVGTAAFMGPSIATTAPVAYPIMAGLSAWVYLRRGVRR